MPDASNTPPPTPLRHMLWLAWVLSAAYLALGGGVALCARLTHGAWGGRLALVMDQFAGAFLRLVHLWGPLVHALAAGRLDVWQLRLVLISLSVGLIFAYALGVGILLTGTRALWLRLAQRA